MFLDGLFYPILLFVNYFFIVIIKNFNVVNWNIDNPWFLIEIVLSWFGIIFLNNPDLSSLKTNSVLFLLTKIWCIILLTKITSI